MSIDCSEEGVFWFYVSLSEGSAVNPGLIRHLC